MARLRELSPESSSSLRVESGNGNRGLPVLTMN